MTALNPTSPWSATADLTARNAEIIRRARSGQSRLDIARSMGLTKNQVVGVCHRAEVGDQSIKTAQAIAADRANKASAARKAAEAARPNGLSCQWIEGVVKRGDPVIFCGVAVRPGSSFCGEHRMRAYVPARSRVTA